MLRRWRMLRWRRRLLLKRKRGRESPSGFPTPTCRDLVNGSTSNSGAPGAPWAAPQIRRRRLHAAARLCASRVRTRPQITEGDRLPLCAPHFAPPDTPSVAVKGSAILGCASKICRRPRRRYVEDDPVRGGPGLSTDVQQHFRHLQVKRAREWTRWNCGIPALGRS